LEIEISLGFGTWGLGFLARAPWLDFAQQREHNDDH
jgi:hypothetical protein